MRLKECHAETLHAGIKKQTNLWLPCMDGHTTTVLTGTHSSITDRKIHSEKLVSFFFIVHLPDEGDQSIN